MEQMNLVKEMIKENSSIIKEKEVKERRKWKIYILKNNFDFINNNLFLVSIY